MILPVLLCALTSGVVSDTLAADVVVPDGSHRERTIAVHYRARAGSQLSPGELTSVQGYVEEGEAFISDGRLQDAMQAFPMAGDAGGWNAPAVLKKLAAVGRWTRRYDASREWLNHVLLLFPADEEAREALDGIRMQRSLHLFGSAGGGEVDYTTRTYEAGAFAGWVDWMDALGGYSVT